LIEGTHARFPVLHSISMEKDFHNEANQTHLADVLPMPVLPKQGKPDHRRPTPRGAEAARPHDRTTRSPGDGAGAARGMCPEQLERPDPRMHPSLDGDVDKRDLRLSL
jgi:hypothetical protein